MTENRPSRFDSLTGLRGLAAISVVVYHSLPAWPHYELTMQLAKYGYLAVSFFFCLSGFVMQIGWDKPGAGWFPFIVKRLARIYPVAMLCLLISFLSYRYWGSPLAGYVGGKHSLSLSVVMDAILAVQHPRD